MKQLRSIKSSYTTFQTSIDTDKTESLSETVTPAAEKVRPRQVSSGARVVSTKSHVVTGESVTVEKKPEPEKQRAEVEQALLGSSQSTVQTHSYWGRGRHSTVVAFALRNLAATGLNLGVSKIFLLDVAELIDCKRTVQ